MTPQLIYALGTMLTWAGWGLAAWSVWLVLQGLTNVPGITREHAWRKGALLALIAAVSLGVGPALGTIPTEAKSGTWRLPIAWFVMPFTAWAVVTCILFAIGRLVQAGQSLTQAEKQDKLKASGVWVVAAILFAWLYQRDPENKISVLTGSIPFGVTTAISVLVLVLVCLVAMAYASRSLATRGYARAIAVQAALIAGSVVFGLPFAFLVITSFKEDRDMSSPSGIVWIPKVTQTVAYKDPKQPLYEGLFEGQTVQGVILRDLGNGKVKVDISRPLSIRGVTFDTDKSSLIEVPRLVPIVTVTVDGKAAQGLVAENLEDGRKRVILDSPPELKGQERTFLPSEVEPVRNVGLNVKNYPESLSYLPPETNNGLVYLKNTLIIVLLSVIGTLLSSSIVSYAFSRMKFPARNQLFAILLATMMLPGAVTLLPQFLIFRSLGWIDTLYPLWVPAFFGSAFNIFLLRQFFMNIPMELEDAARIDGCSYLKTFWSIMLPQIKPALAVIFIWTFMGAWNNFMGPLIYINSPENMPLSYALQLFAGDRGSEPGFLMAFATMSMLPVLFIFVLFQKYFIEGVTLSGLGGR